MNIDDFKEQYEGWWVGKYCKTHSSIKDYRLVVDVEVIGPPSFVYGAASLIYVDGEREHIYCGNAFKPRKTC